MRALFLGTLLLGSLACGGGSVPAPGRVVVGAPNDPAVAPLLARLVPGVRIEGRHWAIGEHRSSIGGALLVAVFDDPDRPGGRVTLGVSSDPARVAEARARLVPGTRPALELWRLGEPVLTARLAASGALRIATLSAVEFGAGAIGGVHGEVRYLRDPDLDEGLVHDYVDRALEAVERAAWAGIAVPRPLSLVARARLAPHEPLGRFDATSGTLFAAITGAGDDGGRALVEALLRAELGSPGADWVPDAIALAATGTLHGLTLAEWSGLARDSAASARARRARGWAHLVELNEPPALRGMWSEPPPLDAVGHDGIPGGPQLRAFEPGWGDALLLRAHVPARPGPPRGDPWAPQSVTLEGDAALLVELWRAQAAGQPVALEVVLLSSPSGAFDGERVLTRPEEWREHFEHRARAVREVGLLAQAGGADLLLVGGSSPRAAATRWVGEDEEPAAFAAMRQVRGEGWQAVIDAAREVYLGPVGLGAELGRRAEEVGIWGEVDVMVLRLHQPAAADRRTLRSRLLGALTRAGEFAAQVGRPCIVLAEGFDAARLDVLHDAARQNEVGLAGLLVR